MILYLYQNVGLYRSSPSSGLFYLLVNLLHSLSSLSSSDGLSSVFPFQFNAIHTCIETLRPVIYTASGLESMFFLSRKGFAFGLRLQVWICLLLREASASLVIARHFISDSQLDAFLNRDPGIRLWMTVTQQCPSSTVFKLLSLLLNNSNLPIHPFSVWSVSVSPSWTPGPY